MTTKQIDLWKGPFGDSYLERNRVTDELLKARVDFWNNVIKVFYLNSNGIPNSVLEIGAGSGPNLMALDKVYTQIEKPLLKYATEANDKAKEVLKANVDGVQIIQESQLLGVKQPIADLVFTYGVLIHTHPAHLMETMRNMYKASNKWIACMEYFAPEQREITYRGETNALWLNDYGSMWLDNFNLRVVGYGFCWKKTTNLDNITFWLMEKVN